MNDEKPLGVSVMPLETRLDTLRYVAQRADSLGYSSMGVAETWGYDSGVLLADLAGRTSQIGLTAGIWGVWGRSAATIAMAAATLNLVSDGRFTLGLGASTPQLAEGFHNVPFHKPLSHLRQTVTQVRALLGGKRVTLPEGSTVRPLSLGLPPQPQLPIFMAATSPKSIRLAGELVDGWLPFLIARDKLPDYIHLLNEGAKARTEPIEIAATIPTIVDQDRAVSRAGAAWIVAFYIVMMGDVYRNGLIRQGFAKEVTAVVKANEGRKPAIVPPEAERLLEQLTIYGTPDEIPARLARWRDVGVTQPSIMLTPNLTEAQIDLALMAAIR